MDARFEVEIVQVQLHPAGLHLGVVEDVVDDRQQRLAGPIDRVHVFTLFAVQRGFQQQLSHAQHAVHRRTDLVTHRGQELALGQGRRLGLVARVDQCLLGRAFLGHVAHEHREVPLALA